MKHSPTAASRTLNCLQAQLKQLGWWLAGTAALLLPGPLHAQGYSYDGNRWYEMELIVFRHLDGAFLVSEQPALVRQQDTVESLQQQSWPVLELESPLAGFLVDFDALLAGNSAAAGEPNRPFGPQPSVDSPSSFRVTDFARDPWIALDSSHYKLARDYQRLQQSGYHEPLWHALWRQPMLGAAQAPAILINWDAPSGQERLQGSIRFTSFNPTTLRVGLSLTLTTRNEVSLDAREVPLELAAWVLEEQRDILLDTYHYFDNPTIGVLLQVRPYELPALDAPVAGGDF